MKQLSLDATLENFDTVQDFIREQLEEVDCPMKTMIQVEVAVEEIYVNIAHYAYHPGVGEVVVSCEVTGNPPGVTIRFADGGVPFNPLAKEDADITLSAEEREIGGLGILMVKKSMDEVTYAYEDQKNMLTIYKTLE